ncbi:MAG TPA: T9SS type A sorting domain-containing protein [Bacteroidia bacterium]|nr:T9SS type A sorting domain-containing protein [Bacteroidia bacterium]
MKYRLVVNFLLAFLLFSGLINAQTMDTISLRNGGIDATIVPANPTSGQHGNLPDSSALRTTDPVVSPLIACCSGGPPPNDNYASATNLTVGAAATSGNTCGATLQAGENLDCNSSATQSVWYTFTATATTTYVEYAFTGGSCYGGCEIWDVTSLPTGTCPHSVSCQSAAYGPANANFQLQTIVGHTYHIQITFGGGGPCGSGNCFTIQVTNTNPGGITNTPPPNNCSTAIPECYFGTPPTAAQITAGCTPITGTIAPNQVTCIWLQFTTQAAPGSTTTDFQAYITSNCGAGTVDWFDWTLYNSTCTTPITCGNLTTGLSLAGLACSTTYNIEYCFETANCTWTTWYWYFNAPTSPPPCTVLPIELLDFTGNYDKENKRVVLNWATATEHNNNHFEIERSVDGRNWVQLGRVNSIAPNGNSSQRNEYSFVDNAPLTGVAYYKLRQFDNSGLENYGGMVVVNVNEIETFGVSLQPNPANSSVFVGFNSANDGITQVHVLDYTGRIVKALNVESKEGMNTFEMPTDDLSQGIYLVQVISGNTIVCNKLIKE